MKKPQYSPLSERFSLEMLESIYGIKIMAIKYTGIETPKLNKKILSRKEALEIHNSGTYSKFLFSNNWTIHSLFRYRDGSIFSLGKRVTYCSTPSMDFNIVRIQLSGDRIFLVGEGSAFSSLQNSVKLVNK